VTETFILTLLIQAISAFLIGGLLFHFAKIYQRQYLYYWSYSFFCLALFMACSFIALQFIGMNSSPSSLLRLANLFVMSMAGYLQIACLVIGTMSLIKDHRISKQTIVGLVMVCATGALFITLYNNWAVEERSLRYLMRVGLRYLIAGIAFIGTAVYILRKDPNPLFGKKLVTVGFFTYGFEMAFLGWLTVENHLFGGSELLTVLVPYHGLFELMIYPLIALGLVVWLLEIERRHGQEVSEQLKHLNRTDRLTGLPNQEALKKYLKQWLNQAQKHETMTLTLFGADKMGRFNHGEGIDKGDMLLVALAKRLEILCKGQPFIGRLYGDVFVVIHSGYGNPQLKKVETLRSNLSRPFKISAKTYYLEVSSGSTKVSTEIGVDEMLKQANMALQSAKFNGGNQSKRYRKDIRVPSANDLSFENELRTAFKQNQFELYYQPIWSDKNTIYCFEALIRWNHPTRGILTPGSFLFLVQQLGLMVELDMWVTEQAFQQVKLWRQINPDAAQITVNLSSDSIQSGQIVKHFKQTSLKHKITPEHIIAEVTENTAINNMESGTNALLELQNMGVQIAIDDFGTGYSSLNYLTTFPANVIKFDRSFVSDFDQLHNRQILLAMVPLCQRLGKKVIVEGVETKRQFDLISDLSVDGYQGFYLSHPVPIAEATKMLTISKKSYLKRTFPPGF